MSSARPTGATNLWLLWLAVAMLAIGVLVCARSAAAATLGPPDTPPVIPAPPAPAPHPTPAPSAPSPTPSPSVPSAPSSSGATPANPTTDDGDAAAAAAAAKARARALRATAQRRAARAAQARKSAAVARIGDSVQVDLLAASGALTRLGVSTRRSLETSRAGAVTGETGRESTLALLLLALSGFTAGVALLPLRSVRFGGGHRPALSFVERHRLELAGISTSCLLVALLVFAGLI